MKNTPKQKLASQVARLLAVAVVLVAPFALVPSSSAATNGTLSLSGNGQSVTKGSNITVSVLMNTSGTAAFAWQADLTYPAGNFSSVSIATAAGSPFTSNPGTDVASGGVIKMSRYNTTATAYNGAIATITFTSSTAGSANVAFSHICTSSSDATPCSVITDAGAVNILGTITGATYTITNPVTPTPTPTPTPTTTTTTPKTTTPTSTKTTTPSTSTPATTQTTTTTTPATSTTTTTTTPEAAATTVTDAGVALKVTVIDQDNNPVVDATVTVKGITGKTDKNGQVTLQGLAPGSATANVVYKGQTKAVNLQVSASAGSTAAPQAVRVTIQAKKSSLVVPAATTAGLIAVVAAFLVLGPGRGLHRPLHRFMKHSAATVMPGHEPVVMPTAPKTPPPPAEPIVAKEPPKPAAPPPPAHTAKAESATHHKGLDPGTIVPPTDPK